MNIFNMPYDKKFLIDENSSIKQKVYFEKTLFTTKNIDQYFIKIYKPNFNGDYLCQGYIYFYLDLLKKESNFIGLYVNPEIRNQGLGQLLISYWVSFCLDNGIYDLNTIQKQRKPFIIYLLKKFKFELENITQYETYLNTISICKSNLTNDKCLFFKNPKQAQTFRNGTINSGDNYLILDKLTEDTEVLDQVLLLKIYSSKEDNFAYTKSIKLINTFRNK